ncbi:MAG: hypothetical protein SFV15_11920 [Polyangiaceae bacterium]|nr:hypothetical protein [Polyangiaceae bacterium]
MRYLGLVRVAVSAVVVLAASGCQRRTTSAECEFLLDRYVEFLVRAEAPKTSAVKLALRRKEARDLAQKSPSFAECPKYVSEAAYRCAMNAPDADQFERCLL